MNDTQLIALLTQIAADMRAIRTTLEHGAQQEHLRAMRQSVADRSFTIRELLMHSNVDSLLRAAIIGFAGTTNARKLGKKFSEIEGVNFDGLRVVRVGNDRDGAVWGIKDCARV